MDYMEHICPILDQCMSALTGHVIKWDHSFKLPKYLMKLDGVMSFAALFTIVNEFEQIHYQAFVPTKSLSHIWAGLEAMVKSLSDHGLVQPILGFTDNVASDAATFLQCIPSLGKDVAPVNFDDFEDLPRLSLPSDVTPLVCNTEAEIESACLEILGLLGDDQFRLHIGFDMEWEFNTEAGHGSYKTALVQIALPKVVYLLCVYTLRKLPSALQTILKSLHIFKIGHNVGGDLAKLAHDFPDFSYNPNTHKKGVIELGCLASEKNAVSSGKASLSEIVAATLQQSLSKEVRTSEWGADMLTEEQIHYAALDAWVALQIWDVLKSCKTAGAPLTSATPDGQPISVFVQKQEVAQGFIVKQPAQFTIEPGNENTAPTTINVSATRTWAVVKIDKVLAPKCVIAYHKKALGDIQNGQNSFEVVVSMAALRTRSLQEAKTVAEPPRQPGTAQLINPPDMSNETVHVDISTESDESENILDDASEPDIDGQVEDTDNFPEYSGYTQNELLERIAGILADVFYEIEKITRTISRKHTLCHKFAHAFSDTMLVPDEGDKIAVEAVLAKKAIKWEQVWSKSPIWLWKQVR